MKKIYKLFTVFCLMFMIILPLQEISAASFSAWSNSKTVAPGGTVSVSMSFKGEGRFSITAQNATGGSTFWYPSDGSGASFTAGSSGSVVITVLAEDAITNDEQLISGQSVRITVPIVAPSSGGGNSSGGNGSTGGSNTIDRPKEVETEAERINREERQAEEKKAAEEREEAARKEAEAKNPLLTSLEVVSKSDKHLDKVIKSFDIEEALYEYAYDLPMFIEDISLKVTGAEGATLDYEADHSITGEKSIIIKASKGEVSQEYSIKLSPSKFEKVVTDDGIIYQDEALDTAFSDLGYEIKDVEFEGKSVRMFSKDKMNLQMITNDNKEVSFYRLNDDGSKVEHGSVLLMNEDILFVRTELPEELQSKTLYGQSYKDVELPALEFLEEVDSSLVSKQVSKGWKFDEGSIVNAVNSELEEDLYHVSSEGNVKAAVVAFDANNPTLMYALIGVSTLLVASLMGLVYMIIQSRKNRVQI